MRRRAKFACGALTLAGAVAVAHAVAHNEGAAAPGKFTDITQTAGIKFLHRSSPTPKKYLLETMGSGAALFDYDNDGLLDIYLVNGARLDDPTAPGTIPKKDSAQYWNRLYHQLPDGTLADVTERAGVAGSGYGMGVAAGDYDNDGYEDLYVTAYGRNTLYHNNGDGTFTDVTEEAGVAGADGPRARPGWITIMTASWTW